MIFAAAACVLLQPGVQHDRNAGMKDASHLPRRIPAAAPLAQNSWSAMGLAWGFNWVATRIILQVLPPWTMRSLGISLGSLHCWRLVAATILPPRGSDVRAATALKILIAGFFNVAAFSVGSASSQVYGTTSRAIVIAYSMPIWAALLARPVLKERLTPVNVFALALCAAGLAIFIVPLARDRFPAGALLALGCAWSWAAGTIFLKVVRVSTPMLVVAFWQFCSDGYADCRHVDVRGRCRIYGIAAHVVAWIVYNGLIGMGLAYFHLVRGRRTGCRRRRRRSARLLVPVVGVIGSALGARRTPRLPTPSASR